MVAQHLNEVTPDPQNTVIHNLTDYKNALKTIQPCKIFTTNYDNVTLFPFNNPVIIEPESKFDNGLEGTRVMYIHGHLRNPEKMVLFEEDFLKFKTNNYFHSSLYSSFVENTTLFLGYSLNDPNIRQILYDIAQNENKESIGRRYLLITNHYPLHEIHYFERVFQVDVIYGSSIQDLLLNIERTIIKVKKLKDNMTPFRKTLQELTNENKIEAIIENEDMFKEILYALREDSTLRTSDNISFIIKIIESIMNASRETGAFGEYKHLARYLVLIGCIWKKIQDIDNNLSQKYVDLFEYVLDYSGDTHGLSWAAARLLREEFKSQNSSNIALLKNNKKININLEKLGIM